MQGLVIHFDLTLPNNFGGNFYRECILLEDQPRVAGMRGPAIHKIAPSWMANIEIRRTPSERRAHRAQKLARRAGLFLHSVAELLGRVQRIENGQLGVAHGPERVHNLVQREVLITLPQIPRFRLSYMAVKTFKELYTGTWCASPAKC